MAFDPFTEGFSLVKTILDKWLPDADTELKGKLESATQEIANAHSEVIAQLEINKTEAAHPSIFVAGPRPFIMWVGGGGLFYELIFRPVLNGLFLAFGVPAPFVGVDIQLLQGVLGTLLGLGIARSYDKKNKTDTKKVK